MPTLFTSPPLPGEYDVFAEWHADDGPLLPHQISVEIHYERLYLWTKADSKVDDFSNLFWPLHKLSLGEVALFMQHMAHLGYGVVSRDDNPDCLWCTELTLVRVI